MATSNPCAAAIAEAVATLTGVPVSEIKVDAPPRPELGDFAVGMFPVAKALKQPPPAVAARVAAELPRQGLIADATATGPFVNVKVDRAAAFAWVGDASARGALVPADRGAGQTVCIDYSSPNISKHLAFHHIRSTVIGHALANLHRALGYRVIGINHLGDWGTTHGMLMAAYTRWSADYPVVDITALNGMYVRFREAMKTEPELEQVARGWFKRLEDGDPEARALWQRFRDVSWAEFQAVYDDLGIRFEEVRGESAYEAAMPGVLAQLARLGLSSESEGALVIELEGEKTPLLLKTKDGTTLYATRDIAAAIYRWETYQFTRSLYVVDRGQGLHFRQLFKALGKMGFDWASRCEHVPFGLVRMGGVKTGTRAGNVVLLKEVFAEAADEVRPRIAEKNPDMSPELLAQTARDVGVGAVVFGNLLPQREKDVDFDWQKVLDFSGDSGPYIQYTHARCASIGRKAGGWPEAAPDWSALTHDREWAVARRLLDLGDAVARAAAACEPHVIAHYLLDLAGDFSRWYTAGNDDPSLRALVDDPRLRTARLGLVRATQRALATGLGLLGVAAPDVM